MGPDGICLDTDGCVWASSGAMINDCARIREHGEVLETIELDRPALAAMLGRPDRQTLFMLTAEWRGTEAIEDVVKARTGQVLVADAPAPGVGWPCPAARPSTEADLLNRSWDGCGAGPAGVLAVL